MSNPMDNIENLMKKEVQFRDFKITNIQTRKNEEGQDEMIVEGVPCVFDSETVMYSGKYYELREKISKDAFDEADMSDVIFNFNHCGRVYARTRNHSLELSVEDDGLHMKATLMPEDNGHAELFRDIKSGLIDKMSFAFTVDKQEYTIVENDEEPNVEIRNILAIKKLYDVSAVDIPAYDTTTISARNKLGAEREQAFLEKEVRQKELSLAKAKYFYEQI